MQSLALHDDDQKPKVDEVIYVPAIERYSDMLSSLHFYQIPFDRFNRIHPQGGKLIFAAILALTYKIYPAQEVTVQEHKERDLLVRLRAFSFLVGVSLVIPLFIVGGPIAALCWAVSPLAVRYSNFVYLDVLASLCVVLMLAAFYLKNSSGRLWWFSSVFCGIGLSVKYTVIPTVVILGGVLAFRAYHSRTIGRLLLWMLVAVISYLFLNPRFLILPRDIIDTPKIIEEFYVNHSIWRGSLTLQMQKLFTRGRYFQDGFIFCGAFLGAILIFFFKPKCFAEISFLFILLVANLAAIFLWPYRWPQYWVIPIAIACTLFGRSFTLLCRKEEDADLRSNVCNTQ